METIKLIGAIALGLFALAGVLSEIAIIIIACAVKNGAQLVFGYSEDELLDEEE